MTRTAAELIAATRPFEKEDRARNWRMLLFALTVFAVLLTAAGSNFLPLLARIPASILAGLSLVRLFIFFHDFQHGTILKGSRLAWIIMSAYGILTLNPASIWKRSHNHHHKNNAKLFCAAIGSYPLMTVDAYAIASPTEKRVYAISRHPLTIAAGYLTIFLYGMCIRSALNNPRAHFDSILALIVHAIAVVWFSVYNPADLVLVVLLPSSLAAAVGSYFFYAQHNYPTMKVRDRAQWDYVAAATESSSFLRMNRLMHWFTGNIGYHHVHHLNAHIPFYRLPAVMAALPELQSPGTTSLSLRDIRACFRLKLWDPQQERLVGFDS